MVIPCRGQAPQRFGRIGHLDVGNVGLERRRQLLTYYGSHVVAGHHRYVFVAVGLCAFHGHEKGILTCPARIRRQSGYIAVCGPYHLQRLYIAYELAQFFHI